MGKWILGKWDLGKVRFGSVPIEEFCSSPPPTTPHPTSIQAIAHARGKEKLLACEVFQALTNLHSLRYSTCKLFWLKKVAEKCYGGPACTGRLPTWGGACTEGRFIREREKRPEAFGFTYFLTLSIYEQYENCWLSAQVKPVLLWA